MVYPRIAATQVKMSLIQVFIATILAVAQSAGEPDYPAALKLIDEQKPNINYDTFCSEKPKGASKIACRIKEVPSVGFLVCQKDPEICKITVDVELESLREVARAGIKTVPFHKPPIHDVKCADTDDLTCSGFLEAWISSEEGWLQQLANAFRSNTVDKVIERIKNEQHASGWKTTANDLKYIKRFMQPTEGSTEYTQICDIQGFFLVAGGFLVSDPTGVEKTAFNDACYDPRNEPTAKQVFDGLEKIISALGREPGNNGATSMAHSFFHYVFVTFISYILLLY